MNQKLLDRILRKQGEEDVFEFLSKTLSASELSSLMMEVYAERSQQLQATEVLRNYAHNRFVGAVDYDPITFAQYEHRLLELVQDEGFQIMDFSPVAPLGSCSALGTVDQKKIISAGRNTEVTADITNVLALEIAKRKKENPSLKEMHASASFRHIRAQKFDIPGFTPYFRILSMASAGRDQGNYQSEMTAIIKHVQAYTKMLHQLLGISKEAIHLKLVALHRGNKAYLLKALDTIKQMNLLQTEIEVMDQESNRYYQQFRFAMSVQIKGQSYEIIDGGSVSWTQQLLQNKKERLIISGIGIEYVYRLINLNPQTHED